MNTSQSDSVLHLRYPADVEALVARLWSADGALDLAFLGILATIASPEDADEVAADLIDLIDARSQAGFSFLSTANIVLRELQAFKTEEQEMPRTPQSGPLQIGGTTAFENSRLQIENQALRRMIDPTMLRTKLVGSSEAIVTVRSMAERAARSNATVIIRGDWGSGKSTLARLIHNESDRKHKPFLVVNCAAMSEGMLQSELFGNEGAIEMGSTIRGLVELANGGTLVLDEIAEISPSIQANLLRLLQESAFERTGSQVSHQTDVRIIATSNRELEWEVSSGKFREDLFYRLNVIPIEMPPLRHRMDDVVELVQYFLFQLARRTNLPFKHIEPEAMRLLLAYHWPGNVRELQFMIERAAVVEMDPGVIRATTIKPWLWVSPVITAATNVDESTGVLLAEIEKKVIINTLKRFAGHRVKAATALGIGVRTLGMKIKKWKDENDEEVNRIEGSNVDRSQ